ncbi:MAG: hypothetical protein ACRDJ2_16800 [Actinomycetota bacterium]
MKPDLESLDYLLQTDLINELLPTFGKEQWQPLYLSREAPDRDFGVWCALLDNEAAARALERDSWDLSIGDGGPGFSKSWPDGEETITYHPFGMDEGVRPLVLHRSFHGAFPPYCELDLEFRLYHNLAEEKTSGRLVTFDASGREIEVVRVSPSEVVANLKHLRQFQAGTQLHLAFFIDSVRYSNLRLEDVPKDQQERDESTERSRWTFHVSKSDFVSERKTFSRLLGKVILPPAPREKAGIWPYEPDEDAKEVTFIIGADEDGEAVEHTSDPDSLANYFGANPEAPHYLTPVYFRREVLAKYYAEPDRYNVRDGYLSCLGLWGCQIDNNHPTHVVVFLGDLGRDLPYEERLHWKQFNVPPGGGVSETNFRRSFLAQWTEAQAPDLVFRDEYSLIRKEWNETHGWDLFLEPGSGDEHLIDTVRTPVTNSQAEMDEQVLTLTKLLIDSLNEKAVETQGIEIDEGTKGIGKLASFFEKEGFAERESVIRFLRDLQRLRSTGSGHRKGKAYEKALTQMGLDAERRPDAVARLLEEATAALRAIRVRFTGASTSGD